MDLGVNPMPIVCDMSTALDTGPQRLAEYDRLFSTHLLGRERRREVSASDCGPTPASRRGFGIWPPGKRPAVRS